MTYPTAGGPGVYPQQGPPTWTPPPPPLPQPARGGTAARLGLAAAILAAALGGGIVGSLLTHRTNTAPDTTASAATGAPTPDAVHAQDVKLCTEYAFIVAAKPKPVTSSRDLVPGLAALRTSIAAYPDASADLRATLGDVADSYVAEMSNLENKTGKGLVEPPKYDQPAAQATRDRAWALCGLE